MLLGAEELYQPVCHTHYIEKLGEQGLEPPTDGG